MSSKYLYLAFREQAVPLEKLVLLTLADNAQDNGVCHLTLADISSITGLETVTVDLLIRGMVNRGVISKLMSMVSDKDTILLHLKNGK